MADPIPDDEPPKYSLKVKTLHDYQLRYWTKEFDCTADELRAAVAKVGPLAKDVAAELKK